MLYGDDQHGEQAEAVSAYDSFGREDFAEGGVGE